MDEEFEWVWLVIGLILTIAGGFGLFKQITYLFGPDFYDVREDIADSCGGCCFISLYIAAALLTPTVWLVIGVYDLVVVAMGGQHEIDPETHPINDYFWVRTWIFVALGWTAFYCCCVTPFSSCIFSCCFIGEEEEEVEEGKKPKSERVATFTSGMQKTMFDPQPEYFTGMAKRFRPGRRGPPEEE